MGYHTLYPDPPSILDLNSTLPKTTVDDSTSNSDPPDLISGISFQSETTQSSSVIGRSSFSTRATAPISNTGDTWFRDTWCILPIPIHAISEDQDSGENGLRSPATPNQARRFWERLAMLANALRTTLRNFRAAPFSNCDCDLISPA